jgi:hypothetical protein
MYTGRDFTDMVQGEDFPFAFDFAPYIAAGENVTGSTWSIEAVKGTDPDAATHLQGLPQMQDGKSVQRINGLVPGVTYLLRANVTTDNLNTKSLWSHVRCATPA